MTVVVTGGTGFLGVHLIEALAGRGHRVLAYFRPGSASPRHPGAEWFSLEPGAEELPFRAGPVDAIIHAATCYRRKGEPLHTLLDANLLLPLLLANLALRFNVPLFLNADTYFNVGPEVSFALPDYAASKYHALHWLKRATSGTSLRMANMRIEHPYGPGDRPEKFCPSILAALVANQPELPLTSGEQKRDFIYIGDVVSAFLCVLENWRGEEGREAEFGVGWGEGVSIRHFVTLAHELAASRTKISFGALPNRPADFPESRAENGNLLSLGWSPRVTLREGIVRTLAATK